MWYNMWYKAMMVSAWHDICSISVYSIFSHRALEFFYKY